MLRPQSALIRGATAVVPVGPQTEPGPASRESGAQNKGLLSHRGARTLFGGRTVMSCEGRRDGNLLPQRALSFWDVFCSTTSQNYNILKPRTTKNSKGSCIFRTVCSARTLWPEYSLNQGQSDVNTETQIIQINVKSKQKQVISWAGFGSVPLFGILQSH